jgi:molybdopterin-guanine dinucleotide biosynthesis adapter protein
MAMVEPFVFQVVGFQNSGKTTFIKSLLEELHRSGTKTGIIKHHGHGGKPDIKETKDSSSYLQTGSMVSIVEGEGRLLLQSEKENWSLPEQIRILHHFHLDIILVEGHKFEEYPKALIIRNEEDLFLIEQLKNIVVVFYRDHSVSRYVETNIPSFPLNHEGLQWVLHYIKSQQTGR